MLAHSLLRLDLSQVPQSVLFPRRYRLCLLVPLLVPVALKVVLDKFQVVRHHSSYHFLVRLVAMENILACADVRGLRERNEDLHGFWMEVSVRLAGEAVETVYAGHVVHLVFRNEGWREFRRFGSHYLIDPFAVSKHLTALPPSECC